MSNCGQHTTILNNIDEVTNDKSNEDLDKIKFKRMSDNYEKLLEISLTHGKCISKISYDSITFMCDHWHRADYRVKEIHEYCPFTNNIKYPDCIKTIIIKELVVDNDNTEIILPDSLETFIMDYSKYINLVELPKNLKNLYLKFSDCDDVPTLNLKTLPRKLELLELPNWFNDKIEKDSLPPKLKYLFFGYNYNQPFEKNVLPQSIIHLCFGNDYDCIIDKDILPSNLTHLTIGPQYKQQFIKDSLPTSLIYLNILSKKLDNTLFEIIDKLINLDYIGFNGNADITNLLPIVKKIGFYNLTKKQTNLPTSIQKNYIVEGKNEYVKLPYQGEIINFKERYVYDCVDNYFEYCKSVS